MRHFLFELHNDTYCVPRVSQFAHEGTNYFVLYERNATILNLFSPSLSLSLSLSLPLSLSLSLMLLPQLLLVFMHTFIV